MSSLLDLTSLLDEAEMRYLLDEEVSFAFPIRRKPGIADFYSRLDKEIQQQSVLRVSNYRSVKEGFTSVSRPAELMLTESDLLKQRPHLTLFREEIKKLKTLLPIIDLADFLRKTGKEGLSDLKLLRTCLEVFTYLLDHRNEVVDLLPRQIPHGQSTKLIGRQPLLLRLFCYWRGESASWKNFYDWFGLIDQPVEFRVFAPRCILQDKQLHQFHGLLAQAWKDQYHFSDLSGTLIVENSETFYSVAKQAKNTLIVWGAGWRAVHLRWFFDLLPKPIYYWGDIDKEGYEIFGWLKTAHPDIKSVLMNFLIIEKYQKIHQRKDVFLGPYRAVESLQAEYEHASRHGLQIEQEQIHEEWPFGTELS